MFVEEKKLRIFLYILAKNWHPKGVRWSLFLMHIKNLIKYFCLICPWHKRTNIYDIRLRTWGLCKKQIFFWNQKFVVGEMDIA